jgi:hypothetical protein
MIQRKLRSDLQTRKQRVFRANDSTFLIELRGFFHFLKSKPLLWALVQELDSGKPEFTKTDVIELAPGIPDSEVERIKHCLGVLHYCVELEKGALTQFLLFLCHRIAGAVRSGDTLSVALDLFRDTFFLPLYEYLDEHVEDYGIILYLLQRFKFRTEMFDRDYIYKLYESDPKRSESVLDKEVRRFLFDQGVDYPLSTPLSPSGRSDVVADLHTEDPLILEVKILDLDRNGYDKSYIRKGFKQIFDYTNDYNKSVGYLLIFNASEVDLTFNLKNKSETKIELGGRTFHIVVVDIYPDTTPSSKKGKLKPYTIEESFLVSIEESNSQST